MFSTASSKLQIHQIIKNLRDDIFDFKNRIYLQRVIFTFLRWDKTKSFGIAATYLSDVPPPDR